MSFSYYQQLFRHYIDVCNKAISRNKDNFPYIHVFQALEHADPVTVILVDDAPKGLFEVRMESATIHTQTMGDQPPVLPAVRINISILEAVMRNPEEYIRDPSKIDWSWVRSQHSSHG